MRLRAVLALTIAVGLVLLGAAAVSATDGFGEGSVGSVDVAAGGSRTASETVHLDIRPAKVDVVLAFDTTGSMGTALTDARADANNIVSGLTGEFGDGVRFAIADFRDYSGGPFSSNPQDYPYKLDRSLAGTNPDGGAVSVADALNGLSTGDGGDFPEAYFGLFARASRLDWAPGAERILVVLGDQTGHDNHQQTTYPDCPNSPTYTLPGGLDNSLDPVDGGQLSAAGAVKLLQDAGVSLSFVTYHGVGSPESISACHTELAAPTGGSNVEAANGSSLATNITTLVNNAVRHIDTLSVVPTNIEGGVPAGGTSDPASWVSITGLAQAPLDLSVDGPNNFPFAAVVAPPSGAVPGTYKVDLRVNADGVVRATQTLTINVKAPLSAVTVSATPGTVGVGIDQVSVADIPNAWLSFFAGSTTSSPVGSTPVGSTPVGSTPVGSTPVGSTPVGSTPVGSTPVGSTPVGSTPVGSTGLLDLPVGSTPVGSTALSSLLLSQIPLCGEALLPGTNRQQCQTDGASWSAVLNATPFAGKPLNALTLADVLVNADVKTRLKALPLKDVSFATSLFKSVRWTSLLLGPTKLSELPGGFNAWCDTASGLIPQNGGSCANADANTTVLQMDVGGQLGSAPVGSTPVGSTPVGSTPVGSTPVGSTDIAASKLALIPLTALTPPTATGIVDCTKLTSCATQTLGDAYKAGAVNPLVTFANAALVSAMSDAGITINDVLVAILGAAGLPWEQLPVQGLQPYSVTQSHVRYTIGTTVDCSVASSFTLTARLPAGFFPVTGSATLKLGTQAATPIGSPDVLGEGSAAAEKLNAYRWTASCGEVAVGPTDLTLAFDAYAGLKLGTFSTTATAAVGSFSVSTTGAPVTVGQTGEPANGDPSTAPTIAPDTLVVGHIAASGDQDFYKVNLTGLPRGTKIGVFLKVPSGTDLDLSVGKPATQAFFSNPVGSTPVGSTPIEDRGNGFTSLTQGLPSETLQDVPVGSTPVGSTPVGSTPVGSTSTTRGDANEAAQIVTAGESGIATIDVTGYNGASSNANYVLRVTETPPPPMPASCPARPFTVSAANRGSLPGSLPASTKSLFLVDKQRLMAMYPNTWTSLLNALNTLAARPEVAGQVLQVDGNAAVQAAYAAWDAQNGPCDPALANNVVRSINDVVAGYRNAGAGLPNLHYIVLLGSDEAIPMARTPDPVTLSPEQNEAADLAFTTSGLTAGNALYASAAQNNILTDGAYGAFLSIPWLGHDLLLPQLSVSRLVESPTDMVAQINQYLKSSGLAGTPQTTIGTLNPQSVLPTGYDFLADGAQSVRDNLKSSLGLTAAGVQSSIGGRSAINVPGSGDTPWSAADIIGGFLASATPAAVGSLNGHYNHYELAAADGTLASTSDATAALASRILFTMGCHGGLNVSDTLGGAGGRFLDWPQLYASKPVAMYIANTGYGYGDSASVALSERLLSLFAKNLHSDSSSIGEQWAASLQQYFATAGAYDVYDEKVLEETTYYGLPFWHFSTPGTTPVYTPPPTAPDPAIGTQSATVTVTPSASDPTQFGLYRPLEPIASREVTAPAGPARGLWITALSTSDVPATATLGMPTIDLHAHEPGPSAEPIFFPASPFTLEHSTLFGTQRDYANVSGQFRPSPTPANPNAGTDRKVNSATMRVFYSTSADQVAPLISLVNVSFSGGTATVQARVTDDSGLVAEVAALVNDGVWRYVQLTPASGDPTLFSGSVAVTQDPEVFVEATDGANVSYSANKGSNFTSTTSPPPSGPQILIASPVGPYGGNTVVNAAYSCPGATSCVGTVPNGQPIDTTPGLHSFSVTATDGSGNTSTIQRTYLVGDLVLRASVVPASATTGTLVIASASLTNTASVSRDVTLSATFAFNTAFVVNTPSITVRVPAGRTFGGALPFRVPKGMPRGSYTVVLRASDVAGTVTATATLTVS